MPTSHHLSFQNILGTVAERKASDLHLSVGSPPTMRVDTKLAPMAEAPVINPEFLEEVISSMLTEEQRAILEREREIVVAYPFGKSTRFRVDIFYQKGYPALSMRFIGGAVKGLQDLGFPSVVESFAQATRGIVLVSGPFGSGRTTTLAAFVNAINATRSECILTIEQPIEYLFVNDKCVIEQREVGRDTPSFAHALASVTDEDVNVVVVSQLADVDVARRILTIAESGRLVFAALDSDSAVKAVEKFVGLFPAPDQPTARNQIASHLQGVICQRLLPRIGGGQVAAGEVLVATDPVRSVIRDGMFPQLYNIIQTSRDVGMTTLDRSLGELVRSGVVAIADALRHAYDKNFIRQMRA